MSGNHIVALVLSKLKRDWQISWKIGVFAGGGKSDSAAWPQLPMLVPRASTRPALQVHLRSLFFMASLCFCFPLKTWKGLNKQVFVYGNLGLLGAVACQVWGGKVLTPVPSIVHSCGPSLLSQHVVPAACGRCRCSCPPRPSQLSVSGLPWEHRWLPWSRYLL